MGLIWVECDHCNHEFSKSTKRHNEAVKNGWKQFCSSQCLKKSRTTGNTFACSNPNCNKKFYRTPADIQPSNLTFCGHPCATSYTNRHRTTSLSVAKSKKQTAKPICKYKSCHQQIKLNNSDFCSASCQTLHRQPDKKLYAKQVIAEINQFHLKNKRIPFKQEKLGIYRKARTAFGSWNKAIKAAEFDPNPVKFSKKHTAADGHLCDSLLEKVVDDFLHSKNIPHQTNVPYPWNNNMTADFKIGNTWIEIFGLSGHSKYNKLKTKKLQLVKTHKLKLISLYISDIFRNNKLQKKLEPVLL